MSAIVKTRQDAQEEKLVLIEKTLRNTGPKLRELMPSSVLDKPDLFMRCTVLAMRQTPDLIDCAQLSIVLSVAQACALGLPPNTPLSLSYLVPFNKQCQLIVGYRGLVRLALNSSEVRAIHARAVFSFDEFDVQYGLDERLFHKPGSGEKVWENCVGAYAVATMSHGEKKFEWMDKRDLERIKARAKAKSGPWIDPEYAVEMGKKTAIRRLCKTIPLTEENESHRKLGQAMVIQAKNEADEDPMASLYDMLGEPNAEQDASTLAERAGG